MFIYKRITGACRFHERAARIVFAAFLGLAGCGVSDSIDEAVASLDNGIHKLQTTSENWQVILAKTRDTLIEEGQSTIANEVSTVISGGIQDAGVAVRCTADFFRDRLASELIRIRATLTGEKVTLVPAFCNADRKSVNLQLPQQRRVALGIDGYNFDAAPIEVFLQEGNNREKDVSGTVNVVSPYTLNINLSCENGLGRYISDRTDRIVLRSGDRSSTIGVIQTARVPRYIVETTIKSMTLTKVHKDGGNRLFSDNDYKMEMQLDISANQKNVRWPATKQYETMRNDSTARIDRSFKFTLEQGDPLNITIRGWDYDGTNGESDRMGDVRKRMTFHQGRWENGSGVWHADGTGDGGFDIAYQIKVAETRGRQSRACR